MTAILKGHVFIMFIFLLMTGADALAEGSSNESKAMLKQEQQKEILTALSTHLRSHYVIEEKATKAANKIDRLLANNQWPLPSEPVAFTKELQALLQQTLNDKHFRIIKRNRRPESQSESIVNRHINALNQFRKGGFKDIRMLEGNVAYVKIDGFRGEEQHQVDGLMTYIRTADALIIDLTENGGGGRPVNYLSSYFVPEGVLLGRTYNRFDDTWKDHIAEAVKGDKRLDVPLFIITSDFTFSAAEAFAYNLQALGRAKIIGEQSGGGAHPIRFFPLGHEVAAIIPNRRSFNPTTKTNWEAIGVTPDLKTDPEQAYVTAVKLAQDAAEAYRHSGFEQFSALLNEGETFEQSRLNSVVQMLLDRKHLEPFMVSGFAERYKANGQNEKALRLAEAQRSIKADVL